MRPPPSEVSNGVMRYTDMTNETYHADRNAISRSVVGTILKAGTATARWELDHQTQATGAMEFGSAFHCAMDPTDSFESKYMRSAPGARNTKAYKDAQAVLDAAYPDAVFLKPAEYQMLKDMRERVYSHPVVSWLLDGSLASENSFFWDEPRTGVPLKCRPDLLNVTEGWIIDWKTTTDASKRGFASSVSKFYYHLQVPWYQQGVMQFFDKPFRFAFVCVEKHPPYNVAVYTLPPVWEGYGEAQMLEGLLQWRDALATDKFVAYPEEITELEAPYYVYDYFGRDMEDASIAQETV